MMLVDSNIVIYSALAEFGFLLDFIKNNSPYVSAISKVEVLGFPDLADEDGRYFESFFDSSMVLEISDEVIEEAVRLRKLRKMKLGDSIVGATAIVHNLTLATRNAKDFKWISSLNLIDPFNQSSS